MKKLFLISLVVASAMGCTKQSPEGVTPTPPAPIAPIPEYSITASAGLNGSVTPTSMIVKSGDSATFTFTPDKSYRISTLNVDGKSSEDSIVYTYTFKKVKENHTINGTFTDSLLQSQLDSIKSLILGEWADIKVEDKLTGDVFTTWYIYTMPTCEIDDWEVYTATAYEAHQNGTICSGWYTTDIFDAGTWSLSPNGKETTLTLTSDGTIFSSQLVSITKDTMVTIFDDVNTHISWRYTSIHHHH